MKLALLLLLVALGCNGKSKAGQSTTASRNPQTQADHVLALLPDGAQVVVELDVARLRANPTIGAVVAKALDSGSLDNLSTSVPASPLAVADLVVLAAYGVGTSQAATITVIAAKREVPGAVKLPGGLYAIGPQDWVAQVEARAALAETGGGANLVAPAELLALRDRAMPDGAPGASLRITARLSFDARIALARQTGLENAPAQLSVWADVVDDLALIVDADSADPGEKASKKSTTRLTTLIRSALALFASDPTAKALGLVPSIEDAKLVARGTWVRTIIAIGPKHLQRIVERASELLATPKAPS
jgi:hypothetical protein